MNLECKSCSHFFRSIEVIAEVRNNQISYVCPACEYKSWSTFQDIKKIKG